MTHLRVHGVDEAVVKSIKVRAKAHDHSAEGERRQVLPAAPTGPRSRHFAKVLASMPNVGTNADFERLNPSAKAPPASPPEP